MATRRDPAQVPYIALRAKVTRTAKTKDPARIVAVAQEVTTYFNLHLWPDNWPSWRNALTDGLAFGSPEHRTVEDLFS